MIHDLAQQALRELQCPTHLEESFVIDLVKMISLLAQYSLTASTDTADYLARLNAEEACKLHAVWLDSSRLLTDVKEGMHRSSQESPSEKGVWSLRCPSKGRP